MTQNYGVIKPHAAVTNKTALTVDLIFIIKRMIITLRHT